MRADFERWIGRWLAAADRLVAVCQGGARTVIDTVSGGDDAAAVAARLSDAAQVYHDRGSVEGAARYLAIALDARGATLAQHPIPIAEIESLEGPLPIAAAGDVGGKLVRHALRHAEQMSRIMSQATAQTLAHMGEVQKRLAHRLELVEGQQVALLEAREKLLDRSAERALETRLLDREQDRKDALADRLSPLADVALARITGATPAVRLLRSLTSEQREPLLAALNEEQRQLVGTMIGLDAKAEAAELEVATGGQAQTQADEGGNGVS